MDIPEFSYLTALIILLAVTVGGLIVISITHD